MPTTFTSRLVLRRPDPTDLVSVANDVSDSMTKIDAAVGYEVVTAFPAAPYSGKAVTFSNDSYRSYFNNGTAPASGGWVELLNSSGTFGSDINLTSAKKLVIGSDCNLYRSAANILKTDDSLIIGGDLKLLNGTTVYRNNVSSATTVANTVTESILAAFTIPAGDASVGAVYRLIAWGTLSVTGTPTVQFQARLGAGGAIMATFPAVTVRSGAADGKWDAEFYLACATTGGSGTWSPMAKYSHNFLTSVTTYTSVGPLTSAPVTRDTTIANVAAINVIWGTANASNTITCRGFFAERVA